MNVYKWNDEKDAFLQKNWATKRVVDITETLGTSKYTILRRARKLDTMDIYLTESYVSHSNQELASYLEVSVQAIMRHMKKLNLFRNKDGHNHHNWLESELEQLTSLYGKGKKAAVIAKSLGVSVQTVKRKLKSLGLSRK
jgi:Zn-dependent peptidase ImmA (M78 family)